jgi:threonine synthase
MSKDKYHLRCISCGDITKDFSTWFKQNQVCAKCGGKHSEVEYNNDYSSLSKLLEEKKSESFWHYFDYLPLYNKDNIISCAEGAIPVERWSFFEEYAKKSYHLDCNIYIYRNDLNGGTNTFKDIAASMAASVFKENNINQYCIASTGNTATAYGKYLSLAGVNVAIFMPKDSEETSHAEIASYGQQVYCVDGDYSRAKQFAADYAKKFNILISSGNIDPIRIESKRTMVFEWLRMFGKMPDVYIQAVSGGTGPLAIDKAIRELSRHRQDIYLPKMLMIQTDKCDPMVQAWENAKLQNFPDGFEKQYPVIDNPPTEISILATGNPATYPLIAKLVQKSRGNFIRVEENKVVDIARLVAFERKIHIGPASAVCILGLVKAIQGGEIKNGQTVLVNIGEGIKRAPAFLQKLGHHIKQVSSVESCLVPDMNKIKGELDLMLKIGNKEKAI